MNARIARKLRADPTPAEIRLWRLLHPFRTAGVHFRKQVQLGTYVVDFACHRPALAIEIDGDTHGAGLAASKDAVRDDYLRGRGYRVLRFWNNEVMNNPDGVFMMIEATLAEFAAHPLPASPVKGEVQPGVPGTIPSQAPADTLPLAGRAGEEGAVGSKVTERPPT